MEKKLSCHRKVGLVKVFLKKYPFFLQFSTNNLIKEYSMLFWINTQILKSLLLRDKRGVGFYKNNFGVSQFFFFKTLTDVDQFFQKSGVVKNKFIIVDSMYYFYKASHNIVLNFLNFINNGIFILCDYLLSVNFVFSNFTFIYLK